VEFVIKVFEFMKEWSQVLLVGVGCAAFIVYHWQQKSQLRAAATEVREQILEIEEQIQVLSECEDDWRNIRLYKLGPIITENLWHKNRPILSAHLKEEDRKLIQKFYLSAEKLERSRADLVKCLVDAWYHKSLLEQQYIFEWHKKGEMNEEKERLLNDFLKDENLFVPNVCITILKDSKSIHLLGTTTYQKLLELSNKKFQKV